MTDFKLYHKFNRCSYGCGFSCGCGFSYGCGFIFKRCEI